MNAASILKFFIEKKIIKIKKKIRKYLTWLVQMLFWE